jgi:hypothetical protein
MPRHLCTAIAIATLGQLGCSEETQLGIDANASKDAGRDVGCGTVWYADLDGDGYGDPKAEMLACTQPAMSSADYTDCDDTDATRHPGASEVCDGVDNDCNPSTPETTCPAGCQPTKRPDAHTYLLCQTPVPWANARATCTSAGFYMVHIEDQAENDWVTTAAAPLFGPAGVHIGASDSITEGAWLWDATAEQFWQGGATGTTVGGRYANWTALEPNNANNEDCAEIGGNGKWNDTDCLQRAFICEK